MRPEQRQRRIIVYIASEPGAPLGSDREFWLGVCHAAAVRGWLELSSTPRFLCSQVWGWGLEESNSGEPWRISFSVFSPLASSGRAASGLLTWWRKVPEVSVPGEKGRTYLAREVTQLFRWITFLEVVTKGLLTFGVGRTERSTDFTSWWEEWEIWITFLFFCLIMAKCTCNIKFIILFLCPVQWHEVAPHCCAIITTVRLQRSFHLTKLKLYAY